MRHLVRWLLPLPLKRFLRHMLYGWFGNYSGWEAARAASSGYDNELVLQKIAQAARQVRDGGHPYERDSVVFDSIQYSWPLLAGLLLGFRLSEDPPAVLDFGGGLGTTFYQNRRFLSFFPNLSWVIVEQSRLVALGAAEFQRNGIAFCSSVADAQKRGKFSAVVLSSVLQYLPEPETALRDILALQAPVVILDLTAFLDRDTGEHRLTIQKVPPTIYRASYPAWFFSRSRLLSHFQKDYTLLEEFRGYVGDALYINGRRRGTDLGFIFVRRDLASRIDLRAAGLPDK